MKHFIKLFLCLIILSTCNSSAQNYLSDTIKIKQHLTTITKSDKSRNYKNLEELNRVANYIFKEFDQYADSTYYQKYQVNGKEYKNVIAVFGLNHKKTIVVGAHYDVCGKQEGADDNASGITGLLELARMLKNDTLNYKIELVAYTLEEPPFFRTNQMGSYIHAKSLKDNNVDLYGMICLEMIGYFDEAENTQEYPVKELPKIYGSKANFIALVSRYNNGEFPKIFNAKFEEKKEITTKQITAPPSMEGIDFSDHLNYWNLGFSAVMITDTSFFRNHNYHENTDTMETLDINKMAKVINTVYKTLQKME